MGAPLATACAVAAYAGALGLGVLIGEIEYRVKRRRRTQKGTR